MEDRAEKDDILKKIDSGTFVELSGDEVHLKSTAYNSFVLLYEKGDTSSYMGYVRCKCCSIIIKHSVNSRFWNIAFTSTQFCSRRGQQT